MTEDFLKKTEELERTIYELFGNQIFASFIHLVEKDKISQVWRRAVNVFTSKFNSLKGEKAKKIEEILSDFTNSASKLKIDKPWFRQDTLDSLYEESKEKHIHSANFLMSLHKLQMVRFKKAKEMYGTYALRSTLTPETVRLRQFEGQKIARPEVAIVLRIRNLLITEDREFNFEATQKKENLEHNIKATLSSYSYIPGLQEFVFREIKKISDHPILYALYKEKTKRVIWSATKYLVEVTSRFLYKQMESGISPKEAIENTTEYFKTLPDRDPEMELKDQEGNSLWIEIRSASIDSEKMNEVDKKIIFMDVLESMVYLCRTGLAVIDQVFSHKLRPATEDEHDLEGDEFVFDLTALDETGAEIPGLKETYAVVYDPEAWLAMFAYITQGRLNKSLYPGIKQMSLVEKLDNFVNESVSEFIENDNDYSVYLKTPNS